MSDPITFKHSEVLPTSAYRIKTSRLVIRCWEPADEGRLGKAVEENLDFLRPWMRWARYWPLPMQERIELLRTWRGNFDLGLDFEYAIFDRSEAVLIGAAGSHTHHGAGVRGIGYWIHKDHTRLGFATEATATLCKVAFEIDGMKRVEIHCDPQNIPNAAIPRNLGFTHEATLRDRIELAPGELRDSMVWSLFADDYPSSPSSKAGIEAFDAMGRKII